MYAFNFLITFGLGTIESITIAGILDSFVWAAGAAALVYGAASMFGAEPEQAQALGIATFRKCNRNCNTF